MSFIKNSAKVKGAAVYVSTLSACLWYEEYPFHSVQKAIRWNNTFEYRGNFIHPAKEFKPLKGPEYDIATDTHHFQAEGNQNMDITVGLASPLFCLLIACSRLSIGGSERKQRRAKKRASQSERVGERRVWCPPFPDPLIFSSLVRRRAPPTEGLGQASLLKGRIEVTVFFEKGDRRRTSI